MYLVKYQGPPGAMSVALEEQRLREEERWNEEQALAAEVRALQVRDPVRKGAEKMRQNDVYLEVQDT